MSSILTVHKIFLALILLPLRTADVFSWGQGILNCSEVAFLQGRGLLDVRITSGHPTKKRVLMEGMTGGVCIFDYDNDGWADIYLVNGPDFSGPVDKVQGNRLFRNNGDATFIDVTRRANVSGKVWGMGCSVADIDNDGFKDLYVTSFNGPNLLLKNNGNGTFSDVSLSSHTNYSGWSTGSAWIDYNNDGFLDLYVVNYVKPSSVAAQGGKRCPYLGFDVMCGPKGLEPEGDVVYRNNGDGTFSNATVETGMNVPAQFGLGVMTLDYDNDGDLDIFVANDSTPNFLFQNQGHGKFKELGLLAGVALSGDGTTQACMGVDAADADNDGWLDIFVTNFAQDTDTLYRNLNGRMFSDNTIEAGFGDTFLPMAWGANFMDYDNDGWKDLFVVNGHLYPEVDSGKSEMTYRQKPFLYHNEGNGKFRNVSTCLDSPSYVGRGSAVGDLNNDGKLDLVVSNLDSEPSVLLNRLQRPNHWILLHLVGSRSNRDAVGARVTVTSGKMTQFTEVRAGSSYLSANDSRIHFGLGSEAVLERVEVRWPSGKVQVLTKVVPDRVLVIHEEERALENKASN